MTAPCEGFVWFRLLRPSRWHRWFVLEFHEGRDCFRLVWCRRCFRWRG
jgi:hypothetical protein